MPGPRPESGLAAEYRLQCCPSAKTEAFLIVRLDKFRKKRNIGEYERAGAVSDQEAKEMFLLAKDLREEVENWLRSNFPDFL